MGVVRGPDADEEVDPVERADRLPFAAREEGDVGRQCLGVVCPMPSDVCDECKLNPQNVLQEEQEDRKRASQEREHQRLLHLKRLSSTTGSLQESRRDLFMMATSSRGEHLGLELRFCGRVKI